MTIARCYRVVRATLTEPTTSRFRLPRIWLLLEAQRVSFHCCRGTRAGGDLSLQHLIIRLGFVWSPRCTTATLSPVRSAIELGLGFLPVLGIVIYRRLCSVSQARAKVRRADDRSADGRHPARTTLAPR